MDNKNIAQLSCNEATSKYLVSDLAKDIITGSPSLTKAKLLFETNRKIAIESAAAAGINNAGFSQEKYDAKFIMSFTAASLSGSAQVMLDSLGKQSLSVQLHDAESYYMGAADSEAGTFAQAAYDVMNTNQETITDEYVTEAELLILKTQIATFNNTKGTTEEVHKVSPVLTKKFKSDITVVKDDIKSIIKLSKKFKYSNPEYHAALIQVTRPDINVHHTTVELDVQNSETGLAIEGAEASLSNSKKSGVSDINGSVELNEVFHGNPTLTVIAPGYHPYSAIIHIESGRTNTFTIKLIKL